MSVYKEFYHALGLIQSNSKRIWNDSCDFGCPVKVNDKTWNWAKQLTEFYGIEATKQKRIIDTRNAEVSIIVSGMDEWAVSDEIKTVEEATEFYKITYFKAPKIKDADGFFTAEKITDKKLIKEYTHLQNKQYA